MTSFRKAFGSANYLLAFEAAVRLGSFTRAAVELNVTQPAVSRQIHELERSLDMELFERQAGRVRPTIKGKELYNSVSMHLREILKAADLLRLERSPAAVRIHTPVINATHWLLPALPDFHSRFPEIKLRVMAGDDPVDDEDSVDIWIKFGRNKWPGMWSRLLLDEAIFPVCSPLIIDKLGRPTTLEDLLEFPLLQLENNKGPWLDWRNWFHSLSDPNHSKLRFERIGNYSTVVHAAIQSQGIALGWKYMVADELRSGRLVQPIDVGISTEYGEFLVVNPKRLVEPSIRAVCAWLLREARRTRYTNRSITAKRLYDSSQLSVQFEPDTL